MWKDLSMRERAALMRVAIKNGIYGLEEIKNKYDEGGPIESQETREQKDWTNNWLRSRTKQMHNNIMDYADSYWGSTSDHWHVTPNTIPYYWNAIQGRGQQYLENNALRVINEQIDNAENVPIYDLKQEGTYSKYKDNSNMSEFLSRSVGTQGAFYKHGYKEPAEIYLSPVREDPSTVVHEYTHAIGDKYKVQSTAVAKEFERSGYKNPTYPWTKGKETYMHKYLDNPDEVYSRMMQFRHDNNLDPKKEVTKEDLIKWRKEGKVGNEFLNRYNDSLLLNLLNNIAFNSENRRCNFYA